MEDRLAIADPAQWAREQFGTAELGDARRTARVVMSAALIAQNTSGSIPQQMGSSAGARALYRLCAEEAITAAALCAPHFARTREAASQIEMTFLIQDTTELNFTTHAACEGLSPIGSGDGLMGIHQQNVLAVDGRTGEPLGLIYQHHPSRTERSCDGVSRRTAARQIPLTERESYWWIKSIYEIDRPPEGKIWIHMGDRAEDIFGVYLACLATGTDWLIRASRNRKVETPDGLLNLFDVAGALEPMCTQEIRQPRRRRKQASRKEQAGSKRKRRESKAGVETETIAVHMASTPVRLMPPQQEPAYAGESPVDCWVVRVWEANPLEGVEPVEWLLLTSRPCDSVEELMRVVDGYSMRWMIEEFHKCEKTGCAVESRRLESRDRLEPLIGLLSVVAVFLLQLKLVARDQPDAPATEVFDDRAVQVMALHLKRPAEGMSLGEFWQGIGRLGGHLGRKCDGPVGWLRAWRGWEVFRLIMYGASLRHPPERAGGDAEMW